jgi:hypothetical protein
MEPKVRKTPLTGEEAAKYDVLRQQLDAELPEIVTRHRERVSSSDQPEVNKDAKNCPLRDA